ncbi:uncharacterized protein BN574_00898 [Phascolarctobacterium sp. CAG:266]|nr:uncharacterized protein BN574_00898 [Phascolarctobacterium sp. CAG:266]
MQVYKNFRNFFKKHLTARIKVSILSLAQFKNLLGPLAQLVEHLTLNQGVVGSRPTWVTMWPVGQAVKTPPFHGGIGGSIPPPVTIRALSSAGRASALQAECQRFDPVSAHHVKSAVFKRRLLFLFLHTKNAKAAALAFCPSILNFIPVQCFRLVLQSVPWHCRQLQL